MSERFYCHAQNNHALRHVRCAVILCDSVSPELFEQKANGDLINTLSHRASNVWTNSLWLIDVSRDHLILYLVLIRIRRRLQLRVETCRWAGDMEPLWNDALGLLLQYSIDRHSSNFNPITIYEAFWGRESRPWSFDLIRRLAAQVIWRKFKHIFQQFMINSLNLLKRRCARCLWHAGKNSYRSPSSSYCDISWGSNHRYIHIAVVICIIYGCNKVQSFSR
jgi:hypothetical protein